MKPSVSIAKIGGHLINQDEELKSFLKSFAELEGLKILVHGGGRSASEISSKLGVKVNMLEGRRVTTESALEVATMVYAGSINKKIVSLLQAFQCDALGVCGADLNLLVSKKRPIDPIDYGFVGDVEIEGVNTQRLEQLLNIGAVLVFSAITHDGLGQLLNTNADTIASILASAMVPHFDVSLYYCFEQEGVLDGAGNVIKSMTKNQFHAGKDAGSIRDGMIPKLSNGFGAIASGVKEVWVKKASDLGRVNGTKLLSN